MNFHCCWQQCNVNITIILDIAPEDNRDIRSGDWWFGRGSLLSSPMIMQMRVERQYPVSVLSVQAPTVSPVSEDTIPLCLFTKKEESCCVRCYSTTHIRLTAPSVFNYIISAMRSFTFSFSSIVPEMRCCLIIKATYRKCVLSALTHSNMSHPNL
jgi:hypothetical protein